SLVLTVYLSPLISSVVPLNLSSGTSLPSISSEDMTHFPASFSRSFLTASSLASPAVVRKLSAAIPSIIHFMVHLENNSAASESLFLFPARFVVYTEVNIDGSISSSILRAHHAGHS